MLTLKTNLIKFTMLVTLIASFLIACHKQEEVPSPATEDGNHIHVETIRFANLPYADHTYSSIGVAKKWFDDVGINLQVNTIKIEDAVPSLESGAYDVVSVPPGVLFSSYDTAPDLCSFVFGDLFQGFAIMAQPGHGYKTYTELRSAGMTHSAAIRAVVGQMRGKIFAYPTENAIKPFIDLALQEGGLSRKDVRSLVLDDPLTVNAMRNKQADFQVGGVPSRIELQKEGFVPILSSIDMAKGARPSPDSKELASILENGWAMKKERYRDDPGLALRLASVNYRIMKFMSTDQDEAISIHMAYLSKVTGQKFTVEDGRIIYSDLDPFVTFEDQRPWFYDKMDPLYYANVNGAILNSFIADKIYRSPPPTVDDVIFADDTYRELVRLKSATDAVLEKLKTEPNSNPRREREIAEAKRFYNLYDYYDANQITMDALRNVVGK
jgi:ABC-type nitrate/sulfonate/bicarbonate transport system substrate-binding protein